MAVVVSALTFAVCTALGLPLVLGILFAVAVLFGSLPTIVRRFGMRDL